MVFTNEKGIKISSPYQYDNLKPISDKNIAIFTLKSTVEL